MLCCDQVEKEYGRGKARDFVFSYRNSCLLQAAKQAFDLMKMSLSWAGSQGSQQHVVFPLSDSKVLDLEDFPLAWRHLVSLTLAPVPTAIHLEVKAIRVWDFSKVFGRSTYIGNILYHRLVGACSSKRSCILDSSNHPWHIASNWATACHTKQDISMNIWKESTHQPPYCPRKFRAYLDLSFLAYTTCLWSRLDKHHISWKENETPKTPFS